jgi:lysophospholipase L1-like esterase
MICVISFLVGVLCTLAVAAAIYGLSGRNRRQETAEDESILQEEETDTAEYDFETEAEEKWEALNQNTQTGEAQEEEETASVSANSIEAAKLKWKKDYPVSDTEMTLEEKENIRSSYEETLAVNAFDQKVIANSTIDFSEVKIAILGDSLTQGSNLSEEEQAQYALPVQLQNILGAKEIYNLGIGGSTVSRCSDNNPMVDRWQDIPMDTDIIIVMGGTNDCLFENKWDYGELEYEKRMTKGTFCGDLDEMLGGIEYTYREHNENSYIKFLIVNPPSTVLNDAVYNLDQGNMVQQSAFAEAINTIAPAYGFEIIDMYNNNLLNSHDKNVNEQFMPDGVHGNAEGYRILAEHIASEIIQRIEQ